MRYLLLSALLFTSLFASNIDIFASDMDYYRDYDKAVAVAKKEDKMIMLVMVADYCPWCRKFERKTLKSSKVAITVQENFIPVIMDRNLDRKKYPEEFHTPRIPNVFFINPKDSENYVNESIGYVSKKEYSASMSEALILFEKEEK